MIMMLLIIGVKIMILDIKGHNWIVYLCCYYLYLFITVIGLIGNEPNFDDCGDCYQYRGYA